TAGAQWIEKIAPTPTQVSFYTRMPGTSYAYMLIAKSVLVPTGYTVNFVTDPTGTPTVAQFKNTIIPAMLTNDPTVAVGAGSPAQMANFIEGWAQYAADPATTKPSHFDTLALIVVANI